MAKKVKKSNLTDTEIEVLTGQVERTRKYCLEQQKKHSLGEGNGCSYLLDQRKELSQE